VPNVRLRIVQPNVAQADKYRIDLRARHWQELIDLSRIQHGAPPTHIIWPEAAPPFLLARSPRALSDIAALTANGTVLMTGAARVESRDNERPIFHNSFYVFGHGARLLATYDKFHLVPFGEYVPFPEILHVLGIDKLVNQPGSFTGGDGPHTYTIPGAPPLGPLICYEVLFPGELTANPRPGWFVNVTDDSWFGPASSTGPYQHFLVARTRAIEEGIPVVRAANTGISAVVDPLGRVVAELSIGRTGILDSPLPKAISPTPFSEIYSLLFWAMLLICAAIAFTATFRRG
jgi:apolipoprotein N-acyltransferase